MCNGLIKDSISMSVSTEMQALVLYSLCIKVVLVPLYKVSSTMAELRARSKWRRGSSRLFQFLSLLFVFFSIFWFTAVHPSTSAPSHPPSCPSSVFPQCGWTLPWPHAAVAGSQFPPAGSQ